MNPTNDERARFEAAYAKISPTLPHQSRLTKPPVGTADKLEYALRNLCSNINDAITREATARVDARETEE